MRAGSLWSPSFRHARPRAGAPRRPRTGSSGHPVTSGQGDKHIGRSVLDRPVEPGDDRRVVWFGDRHHATITFWAGFSAITHLRNRSKSMLPPVSTRPTRL